MAGNGTASKAQALQAKAKESTEWPFDWIPVCYGSAPPFAAKAIADVETLLSQRQGDTWKDTHHINDMLVLLRAKENFIIQQSKMGVEKRNVLEIHRAVAILALPGEWARFQFLLETESGLNIGSRKVKDQSKRIKSLFKVAKLVVDGRDAEEQMKELLVHFRPSSDLSLVTAIHDAIMSAIVVPRPTKNAPTVGWPFDWIPYVIDKKGTPSFTEGLLNLVDELRYRYIQYSYPARKEAEERDEREDKLNALRIFFEGKIETVKQEMSKEPRLRELDDLRCDVATLAFPIELAKYLVLKDVSFVCSASQSKSKSDKHITKLRSEHWNRITELREAAFSKLDPKASKNMEFLKLELQSGTPTMAAKSVVGDAAMSVISA